MKISTEEDTVRNQEYGRKMRQTYERNYLYRQRSDNKIKKDGHVRKIKMLRQTDRWRE